MASERLPFLTPAEYLALERKAKTKSEYVDGTLVAMTGATKVHVLITTNISGELHRQLKGRPCMVFAQDLRLLISEGGLYAYPDVVAVCGEPQFEDEHQDTLLNPTVIIEVLSASTEGYDRCLKSARYRQRASLQEYVLVTQDRPSVERYSRQGDHWTLIEAAGFDAEIDLPSIGCTLALSDIYDKVTDLAPPL